MPIWDFDRLGFRGRSILKKDIKNLVFIIELTAHGYFQIGNVASGKSKGLVAIFIKIGFELVSKN
jgi:hypothetical protein